MGLSRNNKMKPENIALVICGILVLLAVLAVLFLLTQFPYSNYLIPAMLGILWLIMVATIFAVAVILIRKYSKTNQNKKDPEKD